MTDVLAHGYDWAWAYADGTISSQDVLNGGGAFVIRYLGGSGSLTPTERDDLHSKGIAILLVMEQEADMSEKGYARGAQAAQVANAQADTLGYPADCPIFYADDYNDADPNQEADFLNGVYSVGGRRPGMYSGGNVLLTVKGQHPDLYTWRVETWYPDLFPEPDLEQLANTRTPAMPGVVPDSYDTNLLYHPLPMWGPSGTVNVGGPITPTTAQPRRNMYIGVNKNEGWFVVEGGKLSSKFTGAPGAFGVPADLAGKWTEIPAKPVSDSEVAALKAGGSTGGSVSVAFDYAAFANAVTQGIKNL